MKVNELIERVKTQDGQIELLQKQLKAVRDILEERPQLEVRFDAQRELMKILEKRFKELERAHPSICKTDYSQMFDEPREVIPHDHEGDKK